MEKTRIQPASADKSLPEQKEQSGKDVDINDFPLQAANNSSSRVSQGIKALKHEDVNGLYRRLHHIKKQFDNEIESVLDNIQTAIAAPQEKKTPISPKKESRRNGKVFKPRKSPLSELLEIEDFKTLYNVFVAFFVVLFLSVLCNNYFESGRPLDLAVIRYAFGKPWQTATCWLIMFGFTLGTGFHWRNVSGSSSNLLFLFYLLTQTVFLLSAGFGTLYLALPPSSGFIVLCEATRMSMKIHSYFRHFYKYTSDMKDSADIDEKEDVDSKKVRKEETTFSHFVYFMFAPTLIYKEKYPTRQKIDWTSAFKHFMEVIGVILYLYVLFDRFCLPQFQSVGQSPNNLRVIILTIFNSMIPGMLTFVFGFFGLLHCWLNAWADLLGFEDRLFYKSWWNSHSFGEFYPKWNGVVHDWILEYLYLDTIKWMEFKGFKPSTSKTAGTFVAMQFSAFIHEYIISCALGFFYPILWLMFGAAGMFLGSLNRSKTNNGKNMMLWMLLIIGNGTLTTFYCREFYARSPQLDHGILTGEFWRRFFSVYSWESFTFK